MKSETCDDDRIKHQPCMCFSLFQENSYLAQAYQCGVMSFCVLQAVAAHSCGEETGISDICF